MSKTMDPVTAALNLANTVAECIKINMELMKAMSPEKQAEYGELQLQQLKDWRDFITMMVKVFHPS